ncbi:MAG: hypothetical protein EXR71_03090 [Myxococcales bacterium]|nr:hypothetical protein [Myxococcales bacterium]
MRRMVLVGAGILAVAFGGVAAWRVLQPPPPPPVLPLDQRTFEQMTEKEREDWMRTLGYVD